jgi:hypothetical protein
MVLALILLALYHLAVLGAWHVMHLGVEVNVRLGLFVLPVPVYVMNTPEVWLTLVAVPNDVKTVAEWHFSQAAPANGTCKGDRVTLPLVTRGLAV